MAAALKLPFDKKSIALAKAKFRAWWEGEAFDEAAALAAAEAVEVANDAGLEDELFDEPELEMPPRLKALAKIWGEGRIRPGEDAADALEPARIGAPEDGVIAVSGAGLWGPIVAFAGAYPGKIDAFEWREESLNFERAGVRKAKLAKRVNVTRIDLDAYAFKPNHYDGIWSVDDFAYVSYPPHLAGQFMKMLKPGACAIVECYLGLPTPEFATAFASAFAEPQVRAHGDTLQFFTDVGLVLESDEDITEEFLAMARDGFKRLGEALSGGDALDVLAARELAWEAEAWRTRLKLLAQRRLERRRFILRKPTGAAAAQTDAPSDALALETPADAAPAEEAPQS